MTAPTDDREARTSLVYWRLINADILLLLLFYLLKEDIFEAALSKVKVIVALIVAVLVFLGIVKGNVLTQGFTSVGELLKNSNARFTISIGTLAILTFTLWAFISPGTFRASLAITAAIEDDTAHFAVPGVLRVLDDSLHEKHIQDVTLSQKPVVIGGFNPGHAVRVYFAPTDSLTFEAKEVYFTAGLGENPCPIKVTRKLYNVRFDLTPATAKMVFEDVRTRIRDTVSHKDSRTLLRSQYRYYLSAAGFRPDTGSFGVNKDVTVTTRLSRLTALITFFADRGLGTMVMRIPGVVTIHGDSTFADHTVPTGAPVSLEVRKDYSLHAVAREPWDLKRRRYVGDSPLSLPNDSSRTITIKVHEPQL